MDAEAKIVVLETRMTRVERGIDAIIDKLDKRASINWAPIGLLVGALGSFGTMGFTWINSGQTRLEGLIEKQERAVTRFVPREDLETRFATAGQRRDDMQRLADARAERIERDIDGLQKAVVPRGEHVETWAGQRQKDEGIQRQIDALRKDLSDLNTPRDTIQGMQRRIDELERERRRGAG